MLRDPPPPFPIPVYRNTFILPKQNMRALYLVLSKLYTNYMNVTRAIQEPDIKVRTFKDILVSVLWPVYCNMKMFVQIKQSEKYKNSWIQFEGGIKMDIGSVIHFLDLTIYF